MVQTDPIADMLTRIRNAGKARREFIDVPASKLKQRVAEVLRSEGYVGAVQLLSGAAGRRTLRIGIQYRRPGEPMVAQIARISRPGCRQFASIDEITGWKHGIGMCILSTSKGLLTQHQALEANVGGEVILRIE